MASIFRTLLSFLQKVSYKTEEKAATAIDLMNTTTNTGIYGLLPGRAYTVNVTGHIGNTMSEPATIIQTTGTFV